MHLLIVAYHFPPDTAVGALRPSRMADAFLEAGHSVTVVTAKLPGENRSARPAPERMETFAVPAVTFRDIYLRPKRLIQRLRATSSGTDTGGSADAGLTGDANTTTAGDPVPSTTPGWKRAIFSLLWLPDDRQGFVPSALFAARRLHRRRRIDRVITTAPPFSTHLAGLLIKRVTGAFWAADFRDPWIGNPWKPPEVRTAMSDRIEGWLEQRVLARADRIVSASEGIHQGFERRPDIDSTKLLLVRNGIDELLERPAHEPGSPFRILHMGTFYHKRDPRPFLQALSEIRQRDPRRKIRVDIVGKSSAFRGMPIPAMVSELGLDDCIAFHSFKPREEVRRMAAESDLLLLLAQDQPDQVPQKLYEYLGTRVPVLAFVDPGGESARMLEHGGGHYLVYANNVAQAVQMLERALAAPRGVPAGDPAVLEDWTTERQLQRLIGAVGA